LLSFKSYSEKAKTKNSLRKVTNEKKKAKKRESGEVVFSSFKVGREVFKKIMFCL